MYQTIITEVDGAIGILSLNKIERHNALDENLIAELTNGLLALESDPAVRVVVLSATGKSFCAGSDINWMKRAATNAPSERLRDERALGRLMRTLNGLSKPTLARVQGAALGSGVGLIAACDIAIATYDCQFALTEVKLGLIPAVVCPFVLAAIGERHARRYLLTAERFSAAEAYRIGLVHEIVPNEEQLDEAIGETVETLLKNGANAMGACKTLLRAIGGRPIDATTMEETAQSATVAQSGTEGRQGMLALAEKRKPEWAA